MSGLTSESLVEMDEPCRDGSLRTTSANRQAPLSMPLAEPGIHGLNSLGCAL